MSTNEQFDKTDLRILLNNEVRMPLLFQYLAFLEIRTLPIIVENSEKVEQIVQGNLIKREKDLKDGKEIRHSTMGVLVCTNYKVIWFSKSLLKKYKERSFFFNKISRVEYCRGLLFAEIIIHSDGNEPVEIGDIYNRCAREFTNHVYSKLRPNKERA